MSYMKKQWDGTEVVFSCIHGDFLQKWDLRRAVHLC